MFLLDWLKRQSPGGSAGETEFFAILWYKMTRFSACYTGWLVSTTCTKPVVQEGLHSDSTWR